MKTNTEIVEYLINDENGGNLPLKCVEYQFKRLAKIDRGKYQYKDDMYQDLIVILLEYNNEKLNNAYEGHHLNALITRIIQNQIYSISSKFYTDYLKFNDKTNDLDVLLVKDEGEEE